MVAEPYWINRQLAIIPRPRGGDWLDDEMMALRAAGVDIVVSMLEKAEAAEVGLEQEGAAAERTGLRFVNFPITDRSVPSNVPRFETFLIELRREIETGKRVGVHCRACIGRASLTAASLLIQSGISAEAAWMKVEAARGCSVPDTREQREWVDRNMRPPV
jgi:protein-tyrosine phosphatase